MRWLLALLLLVAGVPTYANPVFPALSGRVVDAANIIPDDQEAALDAKLKALEDNSTRQLVVATIPNLGGYDIADYGYQLLRHWGIGQKAENNGAILIVAPSERRMRIEVGYGLEPILTDAFSSVVINTQMVPKFKAGDYPGGIAAGADAIIKQLTLPAGEAAKYAASLERPARDDVNVGAVIFWLFIFLFFILPMVRGLFGGKRRGRRFGNGPVILWGGSDWGGGGGSSWGGGGFGGGGGFSGGGGSGGGGGASGGW